MQGLFAGGKPFERYQNLLTCRETPTKTVYIQSEEEVGLGWAMKDKVSLSIFPIPHVKDCPSIPPAMRLLQWWLVRASGTKVLSRHFFRWRGRGDGHEINFLHRLSVAELLAEDVLQQY
jgi:hypothetical protein